MQDIRKGPPPDNGLEVMYHAATFGDRMLGHGEPIRVKQGERVLFRLLNASASMGTTLGVAGPSLHRHCAGWQSGPDADGGRRAVAGRRRAGGRDRRDEQSRRLGVRLRPTTWIARWVWASLSNTKTRSGEPQWAAPPKTPWDYTIFGSSGPVAEPDETFHLKFEKIPGGRGGYNRWTINGKSWPDTNPLFTVQQGKRYRLSWTTTAAINIRCIRIAIPLRSQK